jgi:hypothetical protein
MSKQIQLKESDPCVLCFHAVKNKKRQKKSIRERLCEHLHIGCMNHSPMLKTSILQCPFCMNQEILWVDPSSALLACYEFFSVYSKECSFTPMTNLRSYGKLCTFYSKYQLEDQTLQMSRSLLSFVPNDIHKLFILYKFLKHKWFSKDVLYVDIAACYRDCIQEEWSMSNYQAHFVGLPGVISQQPQNQIDQKRSVKHKPDLDTQIAYVEYLESKTREERLTYEEANELMYIGCCDVK